MIELNEEAGLSSLCYLVSAVRQVFECQWRNVQETDSYSEIMPREMLLYDALKDVVWWMQSVLQVSLI